MNPINKTNTATNYHSVKSEGELEEKRKKLLITVGKILLVAVVLAGIAAASVFTFGAAGALSGFAYGITMGAGVGLAVGGGVSLVSAIKNKMYTYTKHNVSDIKHFIHNTILGTTIATIGGVVGGVSIGMFGLMGSGINSAYCPLLGIGGTFVVAAGSVTSLSSFAIPFTQSAYEDD